MTDARPVLSQPKHDFSGRLHFAMLKEGIAHLKRLPQRLNVMQMQLVDHSM